MGGPLIDALLLFFLILLFGVHRRHRPELFIEFWVVGWVFVLASFGIWQWQTVEPHRVYAEYVQTDVLFCGGLAFALSFIITQARTRAALFSGILIAIPACIAIDLVIAGNHSAKVLVLMLIWGHGIAIRSLFMVMRKQRSWHLLPIGLLCAISGIWVICLESWGASIAIPDYLLAEVFLCSAILLTELPIEATLGRWIASFGFVAWSFHYFIAASPFAHTEFGEGVHQTWSAHILVAGFGMILILFEASSEKTQALAQNFRSLNEGYRLLYDTNPHPMWIYELGTGRFLSVNGVATQRYGYSKQEFLRMTIFNIRPNEDAEDLRAEMNAGHPTKRIWRHKRHDGTLFDVDVTSHNIPFEGVSARFVLAVDVTERQELNRQLQHRLVHDVLTGLPNRVLLEGRIKRCLEWSARNGKKAAILIIDIDRFKQINDTHGHPIGDACLKAASARLCNRVRHADVIARTGGGEFTIVIADLADMDSAEKVSRAFLNLFDDPIVILDSTIKMSVSIGVAVYPDDADNPQSLRKRADHALYQAKGLGRNRVIFATEDMCRAIDLATSIEMALRDALESSSFTLYYQPICDTSGNIHHFEALLRTTNESLAVLGPSRFIPIAEESGLIIPIGRLVLEEACKQLAEWRSLGICQRPVAVNICARQLLQQGFADEVLGMLNQFQIEPHLLELELTETTAMVDLSEISDTMAQLADAGLRFSIDDFGTGYSSLSRLNELPITALKIDRSFIKKLNRHSGSEATIVAVVQLAKSMHIDVIAEGVEEKEQFELLRELGCDLFQGYLFARPIPAKLMTKILVNEKVRDFRP